MDKLSNELISSVLDHIEADPDKIINVDKRAYLSVESFRAPEPPKPDQAHDVASFRRVCKRFADLGIRHQFTRLTTRFSKEGFKRLGAIAEHEHLGRHVRKFSYMIPFFYVEGRERIDELFQQFQSDLPDRDSSLYKQKASDQQDIIHQRIDVAALNKAMRAFTSLQHVQILRLQDEADRHLLDCIRENHETAPSLVDLRWTPACVHATHTMGEALLSAQSPFTRFSGPMMSPQSPLSSRASPTIPSISSLASRLTCLELHFDDSLNLDSRMRELAPLFHTVFEAATNMLAIHVGFPSRAPLSLALEDIFHHIRWRNLRAFGIQAWKLDGNEIENIARRHRKTLRGLRLRDVLLRSPSRWKDVLGVLHDEMEELKWVSLRRIGYADFFDQNILGTMEVPDWVASDESDVEDGFPDQFSTSESAESADEADDDYDGSIADEDHDDEHGPLANEIQILSQNDHITTTPDTPSSAPWCTCGSGSGTGTRDREGWNALGKEQLGDNGESVAAEQRKMWEQWVVGRCIEHGRR